MRKTTIAVCLILSSLALAVPAAADNHESTVNATVTVAEAAEACILIDLGPNVPGLDFGTLDFGQVQSSAFYSIISCSGSQQDLALRGTSASSQANAIWELVGQPPDPNQVNQFAVNSFLWLGNQPVTSAWLGLDASVVYGGLGSGDAIEAVHDLYMPSAGSDGAGDVFSFQIIWTALLSS